MVANIQGNSVVDTLFCNDLQLNDMQYAIPGANIMWGFASKRKKQCFHHVSYCIKLSLTGPFSGFGHDHKLSFMIKMFAHRATSVKAQILP